jgi:hypothetical protein
MSLLQQAFAYSLSKNLRRQDSKQHKEKYQADFNYWNNFENKPKFTSVSIQPFSKNLQKQDWKRKKYELIKNLHTSENSF